MLLGYLLAQIKYSHVAYLLQEVLVTVISPFVHTGCEMIPFWCGSSVRNAKMRLQPLGRMKTVTWCHTGVLAHQEDYGFGIYPLHVAYLDC